MLKARPPAPPEPMHEAGPLWSIQRRHVLAGALGWAAMPKIAAAASPAPWTYAVRRLVDRAIVAPGMDARMGHDIEGPSLIRAPDWLPNRLGRYYLYFADHKGDYIRLAYADALEGPWTVHTPGALQLSQSGFPTSPPAPPSGPARGDGLLGRAPPGTPDVPTPLEDATLPHIASPDVHVDAERRRIVMYFHGLARFGVQPSRVAVSSDGVNFETVGGELGPPYMRVFDHGGARYAMAMPGRLLRLRDGFADFEAGPQLFGNDQRHTAVLIRGQTLHIFWTRVGDAPERIYASTVDMAGDWKAWRASDPVEVMRPERPWEGADLPVEPSYRSAIFRPVNQLRDPCIYEEAGRTYLLYAVQGEAGIGIAELTVTPAG
ncbi:MAG: hypothetical protein GC203_12880 [Phenylobacterium sp.]|uniref:hypothetical protein n=1 Tax=Phenylobacterium sp. TaxID=1871053 RepID=UPI0025D5518B|nr:hypothetical protein [Phenylobacterium sp.]MBI1198747.1 hypothetical protein [Phenylobacterium sp.]